MDRVIAPAHACVGVGEGGGRGSHMHVSRTLCLCVCVYVNVNVRVRICACIRMCALESRKRNLGNVFCSRVSEVVTAQVQALERRALYI